MRSLTSAGGAIPGRYSCAPRAAAAVRGCFQVRGIPGSCYALKARSCQAIGSWSASASIVGTSEFKGIGCKIARTARNFVATASSCARCSSVTPGQVSSASADAAARSACSTIWSRWRATAAVRSVNGFTSGLWPALAQKSHGPQAGGTWGPCSKRCFFGAIAVYPFAALLTRAASIAAFAFGSRSQTSKPLAMARR